MISRDSVSISSSNSWLLHDNIATGNVTVKIFNISKAGICYHGLPEEDYVSSHQVRQKEIAVRRRKFGIFDACLPPNDKRLCAYLRPLKNFRKEPQLLKKVKTELGFNPGL